MKAKRQDKLLASILTSDILYFTGNINKKSNFFSQKIEVKDKSRYILLNASILLQSIKQIIRLLQYNQKYYKNFLQIITSNNLHNQIIEHVSKLYGSKDSKVNARLALNNKLNSKVVTYIGNDVIHDLNYLMHKTFDNNINSVVLINSMFNKNIFGNYKMFTDVNNYKKLLFLLMVILLAQKDAYKASRN